MATGDPLLDFALSLRGGTLTPVMKAVSEANSAYAYIVLVPLIYWVLSRRIGLLLMLADALGTFLAVFLKEAIASPRPPNAGETAWLASADGYGLPSGHTTAAATTWGTLAAALRSVKLAPFGAAVTAAVGMSRMYLGVHYSKDVAGGIAIGLAISLAVLFLALPLETRISKLPRPHRYALTFSPLALLFLNHSSEAIVILCATSGACAGHLLATERTWVLPTGHPRTLPLFGLARLAIGLPVLGLLALGLGSPTTSDPAALVLRFLLLGVFVTALGPKLFLLVEARLARRPPNAAPVT